MINWISVKDETPPLNVEVLAGCWSYSSWLKPEYAWNFWFGNCVMVPDDSSCFPDGKRWLTHGPAHSQITHWAYIDAPERK